MGLLKKVFIGLLSVCSTGSSGESLVSNSKGHIKYVSLNNWPCPARPTLVNINSNEYLYYSFIVSGNTCKGRCNTIDIVEFTVKCKLNKIFSSGWIVCKWTVFTKIKII